MTRSSVLIAVVLLGCGGKPIAGKTDGGRDAGPVSDSGSPGGSPDGGCGPFIAGPGTLVVGGLTTPRRLAADGTDLYVSEEGTPFQGDGRVLRVPLAGGTMTALASGFDSTDAIAVDSAWVYVVDSSGLWRVDKIDGGRQLIDATLNDSLSGDTELRIAGGVLVYATARQSLVRVQPDGGARRVLYSGDAGSTVRGTVVDGGTVYFLVANTAAPGLYAVGLDGGGLSLVSAAPLDGRSLFALSDGGFLWTEGTGGDGGVRLLSAQGVAPVATGLQGPAHPVVAGDYAYFSDSSAGTAPSPEFLLAAPLCAPGPALPLGPAGAGPGDLLLVGSTLFFSSAESGGQGWVGRLP